MKRLTLAVMTVLAIFAQAPPAKKVSIAPPVARESEIPALKQQISQLQAEIAKIQKRLEVVEGESASNAFGIYELKHETAELDPAVPDKYARIDTIVGPMLVSLSKAEPYLDGYRINLQVGNPLSNTFKGFTVTASYGPRRPKSQIANWYGKLRTKTVVFTQELLPSKWTDAELIFPDTKADGFGYLSVSVSISEVRLSR